eukprot:Hpha_TRINITY_DN20086_c0_g1::TRINITY_DN20086_c0_g1_i1::g.147743::m.147743
MHSPESDGRLSPYPGAGFPSESASPRLVLRDPQEIRQAVRRLAPAVSSSPPLPYRREFCYTLPSEGATVTVTLDGSHGQGGDEVLRKLMRELSPGRRSPAFNEQRGTLEEQRGHSPRGQTVVGAFEGQRVHSPHARTNTTSFLRPKGGNRESPPPPFKGGITSSPVLHHPRREQVPMHDIKADGVTDLARAEGLLAHLLRQVCQHEAALLELRSGNASGDPLNEAAEEAAALRRFTAADEVYREQLRKVQRQRLRIAFPTSTPNPPQNWTKAPPSPTSQALPSSTSQAPPKVPRGRSRSPRTPTSPSPAHRQFPSPPQPQEYFP